MSYTAVMQAHPVAYLAPTFTSLTVQAFQTGLIFDLSITFWSRADREHKWIRVMVAFASVVAVYQTIATFAAVWRLDVIHFGDWSEQLVLTWPDRIQSAVTAALASPIQTFLIRRCWLLTNKNFVVLLLLSSLLLSTIGLSVYLCFAMFGLSLTHHGRTTSLPLNAPFIWSLILSAVLDLTLTSILFLFLWRSRSDVFTRRVRRTIRRIILISWEAAALPAICAVLAAVLYIAMGASNYWSFLFQAILGKFYTISLMITLNSRSELRETNRVKRPAPLQAVARIPLSIGEEALQTTVSSAVHDISGGDLSASKDMYPQPANSVEGK
ncbi:hypothetical protein JAAARDRAFT_40763 [Jaapia argillacea MUCL 33604]|uniref:DUF6534 domain-containing protein n=1 Tax=Jaapia argillacea MUCL 33604 TaxID=933084 RepID=A0A067P9Z5_9AGAM|nr:hypothetical protein JAAARDRAFT_40763 [Jaapia argillacea MUCL 33604]